MYAVLKGRVLMQTCSLHAEELRSLEESLCQVTLKAGAWVGMPIYTNHYHDMLYSCSPVIHAW